MNPITFVDVLKIMFPVLFISFLGFIYARFKKAEPQVIADVIMYLTIPALFFSSFYRHKLVLAEIPLVFLTISAVMAATFAVVYLLRRSFKLPLGIYIPSIFMNSAFVGFPIVLLAYGNEGLTRAIIYDFFNGIFIFTIGIYIISAKKDFLEIFRMPFLYAALLGLFFNLSGIMIPPTLNRSIDMLGGTTIPLALLMLGFRLGMIKIRSLSLPLLVSFLRMGLGALIAWAIVVSMKIDMSLGRVLIIMSALPSAFMGLALGEKYRSDIEVISSSIAICTLLSIIFLPFILMVLK
ncbi:MAG: AEC family transporter [Candidatus Margulisiibacteriota bacterium]